MKCRRKFALFFLVAGLEALLTAQNASPDPKSGVQASAEPQNPMRVRVSWSVSQAFLVRRVLPTYPQEAVKKGIQGDVLLRLSISPDGKTIKASVISGDELLAAAATTAAQLWQFKPYLLNSKPVEVETEAVMSFHLGPSEGTGRNAGLIEVDNPSVTSVAVDVPGGVPEPKGSAVIAGILSSTPTVKPKIAPPERVRVSQGVSSGLLVKKVDPEYPIEARRGRIDGQVLLRVTISKSGDVETVELVSGHPMLAPAAIDAVKQWKYKPYLLNGTPVMVDTQVLINFTLAGS